MHGEFGWGMGWMMVWSWLLSILIIGAVVWVLVKSVGGRSGARDESPEAMLRRRYARGELNRDEYLRCLNDLRK
jgi:putative membrane protein